MSFTIPSGCYALVSSKGASLDFQDDEGNQIAVWPPGLHFPYLPWVKVDYLITKQSIVLNIPITTFRTKDDVAVEIDTTITFRFMGDPDLGEDTYLIRKLVHQSKPSGIQKLLEDSVEEALQVLIRAKKHTEVYGIRKFTNESNSSSEITKESVGETQFVTSPAASMTPSEHDSPWSEATYWGRESTTDVEDSMEQETSDTIDIPKQDSLISSTNDATEMIRGRLNQQLLSQGIEIQSFVIKNVTLPNEIQSVIKQKSMTLNIANEETLHRVSDTQDAFLDEDIQTIMKAFQDERNEKHHIDLEKINDEQMKLNDTMAQASKTEAMIR